MKHIVILTLAVLFTSVAHARSTSSWEGSGCVRRDDETCVPKVCKIDRAAFGKLQMRMRAGEAFKAMDCQGELVSESRSFGERYEIFKFEGTNAGSSAVLMFQNNRLTDKIQNGL